MAEGVPVGTVDESIARRLWWAALETLQEDILSSIDLSKGLWFASPLPALYERKLLSCLTGWVWSPEQLETLKLPTAELLPPSRIRSNQDINLFEVDLYKRLPLLENDGLDPLLIVITPEVQVALALQGNSDKRHLLIRSDQIFFQELLKMLDIRLNNEDPIQAYEVRKELSELGELKSNNHLEKTFWPLLSHRLAAMAPSLAFHTFREEKVLEKKAVENDCEITLLEALTHEVRTPLATIRTLIRSILKRKDLADTVINRLKEIDAECTEQIDRFGLIFNAAELERKQPNESGLASINLGNMLEMLYPAWIQLLERRGVTLNLDIAPDLPEVLSNPERLELMLGGLIDKTSRGLPPGGTLALELRPAGHRLKLQIFCESSNSQLSLNKGASSMSDLGAVLSWNPNTGSLQISQAATQRLLASLGGTLANRRDSALTVFFPIAGGKN